MGDGRSTLAALPLIGKLTAPTTALPQHADDSKLGLAVLEALKNPSYWLPHAGFFACGFHIAFLVTHLPGEVNLYGLSPTGR